MGVSVEEAAQGIVSVVNSNMARAIRVITVERGYNPSDFALVAYGGAGPLHAVQLAKEMNVSTVIIPPSPGTLCSLGLLTADIRKSYVATSIASYEKITSDFINGCLEPLIIQGNAWLESEKVPLEGRSFYNIAEMRYVGQNYELQVQLPQRKIESSDIPAIKEAFFKEHEKNYGYFNPTGTVQFVNFRSEAVGAVSKPQISTLNFVMKDPKTAQLSARRVYFPTTGYIECPVYDRAKFGEAARVDGPCVVEQMDSTTVVPPDCWFEIDPYGNLIVHI
jgi:N-methylhydantoinase A